MDTGVSYQYKREDNRVRSSFSCLILSIVTCPIHSESQKYIQVKQKTLLGTKRIRSQWEKNQRGREYSIWIIEINAGISSYTQPPLPI